MKRVRQISNLVAEELQGAMEAKGITLDEDAFESRVSAIVNKISEAVDDVEETEPEEIIEGVEVEEVYMATETTTLGGTEVAEGEFVEIDEIDGDTDTVFVTVYDEDGEVKAEELEVPMDEISDFTETAEVVDFDEDDADEGVHIRGGKKVKFNAAKEKLLAKLKAKKGNGVNKFTVKDGKIVKKSAAQLRADKKKSKTFGKRMKKFAKKRAKSLKKAHKLNSGSTSGSMEVVEGFDIISDNMKFATEAGDILKFTAEGLEIVREGNTLVSGIAVCDEFKARCISEGVGKDCEDCNDCGDEGTKSDENEETNEAAVLTFKSGKGFVFIKEGSEVPLGNRIRARGFLANEGFNVTGDQLDKASEGELVTL